MRLNQYLARAGFGSRRACEEIIREGAVTINGHRLRELAVKVSPEDNVLVYGKPVKMPLPLVAILHKPVGYLCTSPDSTTERTIYDLLPSNWPRVVYVGRLDKDSEGLLVVTNDGNLSQRLTLPSSKLRKIYVVTLDKEFEFTHTPKLLKGFPIEGGWAKMEELHRIGPRTMKVVLTQGLKRQIREMFFKFGYEVKRLVRVQIGNLYLDKLPVGQHRILTQDEVERYFPDKPFKAKPKSTSRPKVTTTTAEASASAPAFRPKPKFTVRPPSRKPTASASKSSFNPKFKPKSKFSAKPAFKQDRRRSA